LSTISIFWQKILFFLSKIFISEKHFYFWAQFIFLSKIFIFEQNLYISAKFIYLSKISIFEENFYFLKKIFLFLTKILSKIYIFGEKSSKLYPRIYCKLEPKFMASFLSHSQWCRRHVPGLFLHVRTFWPVTLSVVPR